jgi:hypothetical protein
MLQQQSEGQVDTTGASFTFDVANINRTVIETLSERSDYQIQSQILQTRMKLSFVPYTFAKFQAELYSRHMHCPVLLYMKNRD